MMRVSERIDKTDAVLSQRTDDESSGRELTKQTRYYLRELMMRVRERIDKTDTVLSQRTDDESQGEN